MGEEFDLDSARDLASVARTCRRFYPLAMPMLWEGIDFIRDREWPKGILEYPAMGSKRAVSYVQALAHPGEDLGQEVRDCNKG